VSPRCTRNRMAHRVGTASYPSTLKKSLKTRSDYHDCSKNVKAGLRYRTKHSVRLTLILTVLLMVGVIAVLVLRATTLSDVGSAVHATGEGGSFSSTSGISQLPNTGGP
jgi:hypothetical protein